MRQTVIQDRLEQQSDRALQPFDTSSEYIGSILAALGTRCFIPTLPLPSKR